MSATADFFLEIDRLWTPREPGRIKLRVIGSGALLPQNALTALNAKLIHFDITTRDLVDVVVTKLKRFNNDDVGDVVAMVNKSLVLHRRLVERFLAAVDEFSQEPA